MQVQRISLEKIQPSASNPRKYFDKTALAELGASLQLHGQQEPVKVRPVNGHFELVFGERRFRAAKLVGLKELDAIVEQLDDKAADVLRLVENVKRKDLTVFEEAEHLKLLHEKHKVKVDDLAKEVGISVRGIYEALKLAALDPVVRNLVLKGELSVSNAKLIARLPKADKVQCANETVDNYDGQLTHEQLEQHIREEYMVDLRGAPFAANLTGFPCLAATCAECPRNARNAKEEYPELKGADVCTAPAEYRKKADAFAKSVLADAKKSGQTVLEGEEAERALQGQGKYVDLAKEVWVGDERKPIKAVLPKKAEVKTAVARDDEGNLVELVDRTELQAALKKAGKEKIANSYEVTGRYSSPSGGGNTMRDEQAQRRKKLLARREVAALAIDALAEHQHTTAGDDSFVKLLGLGLTQGRIDNDGLQLMLKQWFGSEKKTDYGPHAAAKLLEEAKGVELRRTMVRIAMAGGLTAGGTWSDSHARELLAGLKLYGLKLERFQAEAKKAAAPAKKGVKK